MLTEELVQTIRKINFLTRVGDFDKAYDTYYELFTNSAFMTARPEDQREVLELMVYAEDALSTRTQKMIEAHLAAIRPLTELVSIYLEPGDYEMLGICQVVVGNEESAAATFRAGLKIEVVRDSGSDLCISLMKRIALL